MKSIVLFLCFAYLALGLKQSGTLKTSSSWVYLSKFCFGVEPAGSLAGTLDWTVTVFDSSANYQLLFYDDDPASWPAVYGKDMTCEQKVAAARNYTYLFNTTYGFQEEGFLESSRPYFWFLAVANCGGSINLEYTLHWQNNGTGWGGVEISYDEEGMPAMFLVYWLFYIIATVAMAFFLWKARSDSPTKTIHPLMLTVGAVILLELGGTFFSFVHFAAYANNGMGCVGCRAFGELLDMVAISGVVLVLILLAKGWTLTHPEITNKIIVLVGFCAYILLYLIMFIWEHAGMDPASVLYVYESVPGGFVLALRVAAWVWFGWCLWSTYRIEPQDSKKAFYLGLGGGASVWFFILPFVVLIAIGLPNYSRFKTVEAIYATFNFLAIVGLSIIAVLFYGGSNKIVASYVPVAATEGEKYDSL